MTNIIDINLDNIIHNFAYFKNILDKKFRQKRGLLWYNICIEIQEKCVIMVNEQMRPSPLKKKGIDSNGSCYYYRDVQEGLQRRLRCGRFQRQQHGDRSGHH